MTKRLPGEQVVRRSARQLASLLEMIKFQHTVFALPFALVGMLAAAGGLPTVRVALLVAAAMVAARTAAMTWNRIADRDVDAENPRTRDRALPTGRVSLAGAWGLLAVSSAAFVAASAALNPLALALSPVALAVILGYSLTKRFTWASHFALGGALAIAPSAAWIAVQGSLATAPVVLSAAVLPWVAGFDLLYACQDTGFDRARGLHSFPARFGIPAALAAARTCHVLAVAGLVAFGPVAGLSWPYEVFVAASAGVLAWSHRIVRADDLSRVGTAFFEANAAVGGLVLTGTILGLVV